MNFLKNLDKALDFDNLEQKVQQAALSVVEEFPDRKAGPNPTKVIVTTGFVAKARSIQDAWEGFDVEGHKEEWEAACAELKRLRSADVPAGTATAVWQGRAQDAEYKLFQLISQLLALPDPTLMLEHVAGISAKILELEDQNRKLQATAEHAARDDAEIGLLIDKHQKLEASYKDLQEELQRKDQDIAAMAASAQEAMRTGQQLSEAATENGKLQASLKALRDEYEASQSSFFELQNRFEAEAGSRQRETEVALEDLERVSKRAAELEMERQQLLVKLERAQQATAASAGEGTGTQISTSSDEFWERQLQLKMEQLTSLQQQLDAANRVAQETAARHDAATAVLQNQIAAASLALDKLEKEVARRPEPKDFQELRQRADALQSLVEVQMEAEGWAKDNINSTIKNPTPQAVHHVLQERTRKLSNEVSALKRSVTERDQQLQELQGQLKQARMELQQRTHLIAKLEEDLSAVQGATGANAANAAAAALASTSGSLQGAGSVALAAALAGGSQRGSFLGNGPSGALDVGVAAGADDPSSSGSGLAASVGGGALLDIVVSQRDRFRQRMVQLEEEKGHLQEELTKARRQLDESRTDNVALYEKVRYLERYSQRAAASAGRSTVMRVDDAGVAQVQEQDAKGSRYQCGPFAIEVGGGGDGPGRAPGGHSGGAQAAAGHVAGGIRSRGGKRAGTSQALACFGNDNAEDVEAGPEARAARAYEARVNPFTEFQQSEVELRVRNLQPHDRAMLAGSKLLLGSRIARLFMAIYAAVLHFFIVLLMYYAAMPCPDATVMDAAAISALSGQDPAAVAAVVAAARGT